MNNTGKTIRIVIQGTKRSQILDPGEVQEIVFEPGHAFRDGINDVDDLFSNMLSTAYMRGDCIEGFFIGEDDVVTELVRQALLENSMDIAQTFEKALTEPIFVNYDGSTLFEKISTEHALMTA